MQEEKETSRKQIIKKVAIIFLVMMLILTFFSNTIMNYSLPEVATEPVSSGSVSNKVRGQGIVETNSDYEVMVSGARVVKEVKIEQGDTVEQGQVLFTFEEGENTELTQAEDALDQMELDYAKSLLKNAPDYSSDNMDIKNAKEELDEAIDAQEEAKGNANKLKKAKAEAETAKKDVAAQQKKVDKLQEKIDAYGEVGDYNTASAQVTATTRELEKLKTELSDLKEDLTTAEEDDDTGKITELRRLIRDKELEITNKELDLKNEKSVAEKLKTTSSTYNQLKKDYTKESKALASLQETLTAKNAKVEELSAKPSVKEAKKLVKEKRDALTRLLQALTTKKRDDSLNQQVENLDMQAAQKKIEEQRKLVNKLSNSSDLKQIKAKEDGVVSEITCKPGDSVTMEAPLAKIQLLESGYIVKITITKEQSKLIHVGNEASVDNVWDEDLTATVKNIKADPEKPNQNMLVTFEVKGNVEPGQTLSLSAGEKSNKYDAVVPNNAVREDSKGKFVLIVTVKGTPLGNRYKVKRADVEVLASDESYSGVSGAVYESDNVVTNASKPLEEGMQVRLVE